MRMDQAWESVLRCNGCGQSRFDFSGYEHVDSLCTGLIRCTECAIEWRFERGVLVTLQNQDRSLSGTDARNQVVFPPTWEIAPEDYNSVKYSEEFEIYSARDGAYVGQTFLDAACGSGRLMEKWEKFGCETIVFLDVSDAVFLAVERYRKSFRSKFRALFLKANIKDMPLKDKSVFAAVSNAAIHHTDQQERAVAELLRVSRAESMIAVVTEKTLIGKIWISFNILGPIINRITAPKAFLLIATVMARAAQATIYLLHYTGLAGLTSARDTFANLVRDPANFKKLRYNMLDLLTSPFYIKHPDEFYFQVAKDCGFRVADHRTSSDKDYYFFAAETPDPTG